MFRGRDAERLPARKPVLGPIIVEGPDGTGKTTFCKLLGEQLGYPVVKFPLVQPDRGMSPWAKTQHYINEFEVTCNRLYQDGKAKHIFDRSYLSTWVYQGVNSPELSEFILHNGKRIFSASGWHNPLHVILHNSDVEETARRIAERKETGESTGDEVDGLEFEKLVERCLILNRIYLKLADYLRGHQLILIDVKNKSTQEVVHEFLSLVG